MAASVAILDSDRRLLGYLNAELNARGYSVWTAESLSAALKHALLQPVDVLLAELKLDGAGGRELLTAFRDRSPNTRVIMMAENASAEEYKRALSAGAVELLTKPFTVDDLLGALQTAIDYDQGYRGTVHGIGLPDILQLMNMGRRSVSVHVGEGRIDMREGEVVHAIYGGLTGRPALMALLSTDSGSVRTGPITVSAGQSISIPFNALMLETMCSIDEARDRSTRGPRPLESVPAAPADARSAAVVGPASGEAWAAHAPAQRPPIEHEAMLRSAVGEPSRRPTSHPGARPLSDMAAPADPRLNAALRSPANGVPAAKSAARELTYDDLLNEPSSGGFALGSPSLASTVDASLVGPPAGSALRSRVDPVLVPGPTTAQRQPELPLLAVIVAAILALAALGGVGGWYFGLFDSPDTQTVAPTAAAPANDNSPPAAESRPALKSPAAPEPPAPKPRSRRIVLHTEPPGLELEDAATGERLGRSPIKLTLHSVDLPLRVRAVTPSGLSAPVLVMEALPKTSVRRHTIDFERVLEDMPARKPTSSAKDRPSEAPRPRAAQPALDGKERADEGPAAAVSANRRPSTATVQPTSATQDLATPSSDERDLPSPSGAAAKATADANADQTGVGARAEPSDGALPRPEPTDAPSRKAAKPDFKIVDDDEPTFETVD